MFYPHRLAISHFVLDALSTKQRKGPPTLARYCVERRGARLVNLGLDGGDALGRRRHLGGAGVALPHAKFPEHLQHRGTTGE